MMKMQIAIDEQKAIANGIDPKKVYAEIDAIFESVKATKEVLSDGTLEYTNNQNAPQKELSDMGIAFYKLRHLDVFAKSCKKWLWLESEEDDDERFTYEDVLADERKRNRDFGV